MFPAGLKKSDGEMTQQKPRVEAFDIRFPESQPDPVYISQSMRASPPKMCFSCGRNLPEKDFDLFHSEKMDKTDKAVLDKMGYPKMCCRRMFISDAVEYRNYISLYDDSTR